MDNIYGQGIGIKISVHFYTHNLPILLEIIGIGGSCGVEGVDIFTHKGKAITTTIGNVTQQFIKATI